VNDRIRAQRCRLIGADGSQLGIFSVSDAMQVADDQSLDLVEIAPNADPPVCRVMDYGKYKYELAMKAKRARKHQTTVQIKEIKFRPKIDNHDYGTKRKHVERFLKGGAKVKVTIMFRGREMAHAERGLAILERLASDIAELGHVEAQPKLEGRNMFMLVAPHKKDLLKLKQQSHEDEQALEDELAPDDEQFSNEIEVTEDTEEVTTESPETAEGEE
jgi:translation initiation factor IF-3